MGDAILTLRRATGGAESMKGGVEHHDDEVEQALWIPLENAAERLAYGGEREIAGAALSKPVPGR